MRNRYNDVSSALSKLENCVRTIKIADSVYNNRKSILFDSINKLQNAVNIIKACDRMFADNRGKRTDPRTSQKPSVWEIQTMLGLPYGNNNIPSKYKGAFDKFGNYVVLDISGGKGVNVKPYRTMTKAEMDRAWNEFIAKQDEEKLAARNAKANAKLNSQFGYAGNTNVSGEQTTNYIGTTIANSGDQRAGVFVPAPVYLQQDTPRLEKLTKALKLIGEVGVALAAINFTGMGDKIAEAGKQVGRFTKFLAQKAGDLKNKVVAAINNRRRR